MSGLVVAERDSDICLIVDLLSTQKCFVDALRVVASFHETDCEVPNCVVGALARAVSGVRNNGGERGAETSAACAHLKRRLHANFESIPAGSQRLLSVAKCLLCALTTHVQEKAACSQVAPHAVAAKHLVETYQVHYTDSWTCQRHGTVFMQQRVECLLDLCFPPSSLRAASTSADGKMFIADPCCWPNVAEASSFISYDVRACTSACWEKLASEQTLPRRPKPLVASLRAVYNAAIGGIANVVANNFNRFEQQLPAGSSHDFTSHLQLKAYADARASSTTCVLTDVFVYRIVQDQVGSDAFHFLAHCGNDAEKIGHFWGCVRKRKRRECLIVPFAVLTSVVFRILGSEVRAIHKRHSRVNMLPGVLLVGF